MCSVLEHFEQFSPLTMRSTALTASLLATALAKDAPTLLGRASTDATTGWCHPGYAQAINTTTGHNRCIACPAGKHSQGGVSSACTTMADDWTTCSHIGCKLVSSDTHCNFHSSANPAVDLVTGGTIATVASSCHDSAHAGVQRISIFHHGSEENGMFHECSKNTGGVNGARGACECKCKRGFDYVSPPADTVETSMSLGGFTCTTFDTHTQFAVQTAIAVDFGVDITHVELTNVTCTSGDRRLQAGTSVSTDPVSTVSFDITIMTDSENQAAVTTQVNTLSADSSAQESMVESIEAVMVAEHISTDNLELSVACQEVNTGSVDAQPCTLDAGEATCSTTVTWTSSSPSACIYLQQTGQLFACGQSGSQVATWIGATPCDFVLHESRSAASLQLGSAVGVRALPYAGPAYGFVDAPPCTLDAGKARCSTTVTWNSSSPSTCLYVNSGPKHGDQLFACGGGSGSQVASWISASPKNFTLHAGRSTASMKLGSAVGVRALPYVDPAV